MADQSITPGDVFADLLRFRKPEAIAWVKGGTAYPRLSGLVKFYSTPYGGVLMEAELFNLPNHGITGSTNYYAMHIHEHGDCSGDFSKVGGHYNPTATEHPYHRGDLLPLLGNEGYAWLSYYDKRFSIQEVTGRPVIIHLEPDDFTTQPSGNSGMMIGCGVIRKNP